VPILLNLFKAYASNTKPIPECTVINWHGIFNIILKYTHMKKVLQSEFIRAKIRDCGQAMIYRSLDDNHRQVLSFKKKFDIDNFGRLEFGLEGAFADKYAADVFPVEFFFYKKGNSFYVTAKGLAVRNLNKENEHEMDNVLKENLISAQIDSIEFTEFQAAKKKGIFNFDFSSFLSL
jgi:hypothetical protein